MQLLSRYVKRSAFFAICTAILGLLLLQLVFSYLGELENLSDTYTLTEAFKYIFYRSPYFLEQFIPTGALLGAVVGLGLLANKNELVVMRSSGISIHKIVSWVLQPAVIFVLLALAINQFVLPTSNYMADRIGDDKSIESVLSVRGYWTTQPIDLASSKQGKEVIYVDYADTRGDIGLVKRWQLDEQGNLLNVTSAVNGHYLGKKANLQVNELNKQAVHHEWQLNNITTLNIEKSFNAQQKNVVSDTISLPIAPQSVYLLTRDAEDLSLTQLYEHREFMKSQAKRSIEHELAFWQKLLSPLSILSLVIVACSFVFGSLRTHSLGSRIVVALLFGLFFSYMQDLVGFVSLATGWSPPLMVILPIMASALFGIYLLNKQR